MKDDFLTWPENQEAGSDFLSLTCPHCSQEWRIHPVLVKSRLRCRCGTWIEVPVELGHKPRLAPPETSRAEFLPQESPPETADHKVADHEVAEQETQSPTRVDAVLATFQNQSSQGLRAPPSEFRGVRSATGEPLQPDENGEWSLRSASNEDRTRFTNRMLLEIAGIMGAFLLPMLVVQFCWVGADRALAMPAVGIFTGLGVLLVARSHPRLALEGLRGTRLRYFLEAAITCVGFLLVARAWIALIQATRPEVAQDGLSQLTDTLDLPLALFVIALVPGFFEEIAFRGLILGRMCLFFGLKLGIFISAVAFALAHGVSYGTPIHFLIGLYLAWLRVRSKSLVPGMFLHAGYNGSLLLLSYYGI